MKPLADGDASVIVVGGGIAGLVVARDLAVAGSRVIVLEGADRFGGQLAAITLGGVAVDSGAESFATRGGGVASLIADLGLDAEIVAVASTPAWVLAAGRPATPLPEAAILGIPMDPMAPDVVAAIGRPAAWRARLDGFIPLGSLDRYETVGELVRSRMGASVLDRLVAPVVRGVYSTTPDALPLDVAAPALRAALGRTGSLAAAVGALRAAAPAGSQVAGLQGGINRLIAELATQALAHGADLRRGTRVVEVTRDSVTLEDGSRLAGRVVVAAPGVASPPRRTREITVALALVEAEGLDDTPRGAGVLVAERVPGIRARAFTHVSAKWPGWTEQLPPHQHLVRLSYDAPPENAAEVVVADLRAITGVDGIRVRELATRRWVRTLESEPAGDVLVVGEAASRTGLAAIVPDARALAARLVEVVA